MDAGITSHDITYQQNEGPASLVPNYMWMQAHVIENIRERSPSLGAAN